MALLSLLPSDATSTAQALLYALTTLLSLTLLHALLRALTSPHVRIPGPPLARLTKLWYLCQIQRADFHGTNIALHARHGPVVRVAPRWFSLDDPGAVRAVYGHGTRFVKGSWYVASGDPDACVEDIFSGRDVGVHAANRRKVAGLYAMSMLVRMEGAVDATVAVMEARLGEMAG
ncbi:uncharacterized protein K452DRAFT_291318 [Aplosporella prunicola CBS 121167]|uniref:Cytochrome P450 n=1 Tax=Aplosporella prunicola CBS 121167 TaxID=1176127 RepID=A0A6A6B0L2_9PEZI|nr:uncharacterized protein K452DRAFT_291318 [Aplosporella prunicola CBS 121167]KAF2137719.1 hypothetical protein K452DRAFT_291318 [Aplosporella prunicola CBS 121167]